MLHIADLDIYHDLEEIGRAVSDLQVSDVAALLADRRRQAAEIARLVGDRDVDPTNVSDFRFVTAPGDIEPAFRLVSETAERVAVDRVNCDSLAGRDDADDALAGQRVTTAGEMQGHAWNETANWHRRVAPGAAPPRPVEWDDFVLVLGRQWKGGVGNLSTGRQPLTDCDVQILDGSAIELRQNRFERPFGKVMALLPERLLHDRTAEIEVLGALLRPDKAADAGARLAGDDKPLPGRRRGLRLRGDDLNLIAVLQLRAQRQQAAVDLGADAGIADLGMHCIGEIDRGGTARQRDQIAFRREGEDLILEHFELGVLEEFLRVGGLFEDFEQFAQP